MTDPRPFPLKDDDWARLSKIGDLPATARPELEYILGLGKFLARLDSESTPRHWVKKRLADIRRKAEDLISDLHPICVVEPDVFMALISPERAEDPYPLSPEGPSAARWASDAGEDGPVAPSWAPPLRTRARLFDERVKAVQSLAQWLKYGEDHIGKGERGNKTAGAHAVTRGIDALLRSHTRHKLTASQKHPDLGKELLGACLEILHMGVEADSMVRWLVSERNKVPAKAS
jgi:hypothetical protein